ncbi:MAG: PKD domain-containing protein [Reichenbachiella sp.]
MKMKTELYSMTRVLWTLLITVPLVGLVSCSNDEGSDPVPDPIASFKFEVSESDFLTVTFTSFSQSAESFAWNFGDGAGTSTEENPTYTYSAAGTYSVDLTVTNAYGSHSQSQDVQITDPDAASKLLTGETGKTWFLLADASGGNPIQVGPQDRSQIWWALGTNDELCSRACLFNDTWTFNPDGSYIFDNAGDFFGEFGVWPDEVAGCFDATVADNFVGAEGQDLSGWNSGTYQYTYDPGTATLTVTGGFIGLTKAASTEEVTEPQASVTYKNVTISDGATADTLYLETEVVAAGGYWGFTLVSYNSESDIVEVGVCDGDGDDPPIIDAVSVDFEENAPEWEVFGGTDFNGAGVVVTIVDNPVSGGINQSAKVLQLDEADGSQGWSGVHTTLEGKIDFSSKTAFKVKVYSSIAGAVIKFKLEDSLNPDINKEIDQTITSADAWEELTFVFTAEDSEKFDKIVLFADFLAEVKTGDRTHYFDDILLTTE